MAIRNPVYRRVYYRPQPWTDEGRIEVGKLVRAQNGTRFVSNSDVEKDHPHLRVEDVAVIRIANEDLGSHTNFNRLPSSIGPHFVLGEPYKIMISLGGLHTEVSTPRKK